MKRTFYLKRIVAMVLVLAMLVQEAPMNVLAETIQNFSEAAGEEEPVIPFEEEEEIHISAEIREERTETTKTFLMSDGSYLLAAYDQPVHVDDGEGVMKEIDNTFVEEEGAGAELFSLRGGSGTTVYTNPGGNHTVRFIRNEVPDTGARIMTAGELAEEAPSEEEMEEEASAEEAMEQEAALEETMEHGVCLETAGGAVCWSYEGISVGNIQWEEKEDESGMTEDEQLLYVSGAVGKGLLEEAFVHTDLEYIISPEGIKENLILKDSRAGNSWTMELETGGLTAVTEDAHVIALRDGEGKTVMSISAPYMTDAEGKMSDAVFLSAGVSEGKARIVLTADREFLEAEDTVYPVCVDPYFYVVSDSEVSISDTFLSASKPSTSMRSNGVAAGSLIVGRESSTYGRSRALLRMDDLPALPAGSVITDARLILKNYYSYSAGKGMTVEVRRATGDWTQNGATWNNSSTLYDTVVQDCIAVPEDESPSGVYDQWEITRLMKGWYEGTVANQGLMLTAFDVEAGSSGYSTKYYSSNHPYYAGILPTFSITFRNNAGLEDYWTYHIQSVDGGTGYTNDYSGNLVFTVPVAGTTGANMPVTMSFVYNGYASDSQFRTGSVNGYGWSTGFSQRVDPVGSVPEYAGIADELEEEGFEYVWTDSDGTHHFFKKQDDGTYKDEDGLGLTLKIGGTYGQNQNIRVIEDKEGGQTGFYSNGYLMYSRNSLGQSVDYSYSGTKISRVTDGAGRVLTVTSGSSGLITGVQGPEGTVQMTYSGNDLTKIAYPDGTSVSFAYTSVTAGGKTYHLLSSVTGKDGIKICYEYASSGTAQQRCRVRKVTEKAADGTAGSSMSMDYSLQNCTEFTYTKTSGTLSETYQFNDWGQTTGVLGSDGSTVSIDRGTSSGSSAKNKVTKTSAGSRYVDNLLTDHSLEYGTGSWSAFHWSGDPVTAVKDSSVAYLGKNSLKVAQTGTDYGKAGFGQTVPLTEGGTYTFSAYVKTEGVVSAGNGAGLCAARYVGTEMIGVVYGELELTGTKDWQRVSVTFEVPDGITKVIVYAGLMKAGGTAWFDCFQLEKNDTAGRYNLIENGNFSSSTRWGGSSLSSGDGVAGGQAKITGASGANKYVSQQIPVNRAGVALELRASAKADALPLTDGAGRMFSICIGFYYADGTSEWKHKNFNPDVSVWQTMSQAFAPSEANKDRVIDYIRAYVQYYKEANTAYFDNVMLNIDETGTTYAYDSKGNMISSTDNAGRRTTYTMDNATNMVKAVKDETDTTYSYTYDETYKRRLKSAKENATGTGFEYTYGTGNNLGNVETVRMGTVGSMTDGKYMETSWAYTENGAYVRSETDQRGNTTEYTVDAGTGRITVAEDPAGNVTTYTYDQARNVLTGVSSGGSSVSYAYSGASEGIRLAGITANGQSYGFAYDEWSNLESVTAGDRTLAANTYEAGNGNLVRVDYGNGARITYEYDRYDRLTAEKEGTEYIARYHYDADGNLARVEDVKNDRAAEYAYDISGRLTVWQDPLGTLFFGYDNQDRSSRTTVVSGGQEFTTAYAYLEGNRPGTTSYAQGKTEREYDSLQRESVHKVYPGSSGVHLRTETGYYDIAGTNKTTGLPVEYNNYAVDSSGSQAALAGYTSFEYEYDENGNITAVTEKKGSQEKRTAYGYDALGQLVREDNERTGRTYRYTYDSGGNLTGKEEYAYTTAADPGTAIKTVNYTYGDSGWKDLLTAYDGQAITYDGIGNPLTYRDGMSFVWEEGRQLERAVLSNGTRISYEYDTDGNRTAKTAGGERTEYLTDGTSIYVMKKGGDSLIFLYDATGRREGFLWYSGTQKKGAYSYVYNLQGDVAGIVDGNMNLVVSYEYDSWGRLLSQEPAEGTVGNLNPFRYRGYCYDVETGFYYVSSRYYDPGVGRFISADEYITTGQGVLSYNMYAYCLNNPVNRVDPTGNNSILTQMWTSTMWWLCAVDSVLPIGDMIYLGGALLLGAAAINAHSSTTITVPNTTTYKPIAESKAKEEEKVTAVTKPNSSSTPIYRYGGTNPGNLVPREKDVLSGTGLSFSTVAKPGAAMTTMEAVNSTGVLIAVQDGPTHVSVYPVGTTMEGWRNAGAGSIWTMTLKSIVIKWTP